MIVCFDFSFSHVANEVEDYKEMLYSFPASSTLYALFGGLRLPGIAELLMVSPLPFLVGLMMTGRLYRSTQARGRRGGGYVVTLLYLKNKITREMENCCVVRRLRGANPPTPPDLVMRSNTHPGDPDSLRCT